MLRLKIEQDSDAQNPRDDDNADVMFCKHGRYTLGDEGADDPMAEVSCVYLTSPNGRSYVLDDSDSTDGTNLILDDVLEMLHEHADQANTEDAERAADAIDYLSRAKWNTEHRLRPGIALCRPLFLYDHSGITISAGKFGCPFDSGQVGWQYITDDALQLEWNGDRAKAEAYMDATLKTYDDYITGNVYGFTVEKGIPVAKHYPNGHIEHEIEWEHEDSCWGFIGDWQDSGIREHLPDELHAVFDCMTWSDVGEWQYTDDVEEEDHE